MTAQKRILIVDDEKMNRDLLVDLLKPFYQVMVAKNGDQALTIASAANCPPDLILLDIMMPEMDGYEVCQRLKAKKDTMAIPVIFVTAMAEVSDESMGLKLGAVDYIIKPVVPGIVLARVETHLKLRQMQVVIEERNRALEEVIRLREDVEHIMRHDLKTPLNAFITAPTLFSDSINEQDKQLLQMMEQAGHTMLNMINNSLDLYKMETGVYQLKAAPLNLLAILRAVLQEVHSAPVATGKTSTLRLHGKTAQQTDTFHTLAEEMLCYPMFSNLLLNAFEASPADATVEIDLEQTETGASVIITNQGAVPDSIRDHFFDKYITKGKSGGTGLGTYSAMLCARTQQGTITLASLPDERTRIIVTLPKIEKSLNNRKRT